MKYKMIGKNLRQTIKNSLGRFVAIIAIIALGAAIFVGLLSTKADMVATGQKYSITQNMFDLRLISSYGWSPEDVERISQISGIVTAEGAISMDVYGRGHNAQEDAIYRLHAIPDTVNKVYLLGGRMPENPDECLVDGFHADDSVLGTTFTISSANDEDTMESLEQHTFTVVGYVSTPLYMDLTRGTTSMGSGSISSYVYIPKESFSLDYFTEVYVTVEGDHTIYTDVYDQLLENHAERIEPLLKPLAVARFEKLLQEAQNEYADGLQEYEDGYAEYIQSRDEVYAELADAYRQLVDAQKEIDDNWVTLLDGEKQLADGQIELDAQRKKLSDARQTLMAEKAKAYAQLADANSELMTNYKLVSDGLNQVEDGLYQIDAGLRQLDDGIVQLEDGLAQLSDGLQQLDTLIGILDTSIQMAEAALGNSNNPAIQQRLEELKRTRAEYVAQKEQLLRDQASYSKQLEELKQQRKEVAAQRDDLLKTKAELEKALKQIEAGMRELQNAQTQANTEFAAAEAQIQSGEFQLEAAQKELDAMRLDLAAGKKALEEGQLELDQAMADYLAGKAEADEEFSKAEKELLDAKNQLADAKQMIEEMEPAEVFVLDRNTNPGYVSLDSSSDIVAGVSKIFPAFFLAIAALVCITTMTRMVDEERTQIGVLKAMGYSSLSIISKYLLYAGIAAVLGCGLGVLAGSVIFPIILWNAYCIMLNITPMVVLEFNVGLCLTVVIAYTIVVLTVTWYCCHRELKEVPAELIRPKPPTSGKKIFLEFMPFWNKISFLNKVMLRNVFRYRQRLLMMMLGIGGCTALLLTGFGLQDSLTDVVNYQYEHIAVYDMEVYFKDGLTDSEQESFYDAVRGKVDRVGFFHQSSVEIDFDNKTKEILMLSADDSIRNFIHFHRDGNDLGMPEENEVFITIGMAEMLGLEKGDTISVRNAEMQAMKLKVSGIFENHVSNFMIVLPETIRSNWGTDPEYQMAHITVRDYQDPSQTAAMITGMDTVMNVVVSQETADTIGGMMDALDLVVVTILVCAGLLAVIVLYNLTNINITERIREIATIKVLGFNAKETSAYVFKENILLSVMGAVVGLFFGVWLLEFVISYIKIDMVWFATRLNAPSYVLSLILTMVSALIVDFIFYFKLEKINMAEALKSVE